MTESKRARPDDSEFAPLDSRAVFLLSQIGHHVASSFAMDLQQLDIQPRHFAVLNRLVHADGQTQQQVADDLDIHRNVMVGVVDDLERLGLAKRERHADDRRAYALRLTAAGKRVLRRAHHVADSLEDELMAALPPADRVRLIEELRTLANRLGLDRGQHPALRTEH